MSSLDFVNSDHYVGAYKIYLKLSSQREADIRCLQKNIPKALQQLSKPQNRPRFKMLSIGAGDGFMDQEILKIVKEGYLNADKQLEEMKILNTAVEPHPHMIKQYKASIERRSVGDKGSIEFDLKPMSFEEYAVSKHDPNQYDMIQAIHCLYYLDVESALEHCFYNELGDKGLIACFLADRECIIYHTQAAAKKGRDAEDNKRPLTNADDISAIAEKNKWKFERIECPYSIDVTGILKDNSDEGRILIDFLSLSPSFCQSADQEVIDGVLEILRNRSTEEDDGRSVVKSVNELILIYKV